jgi:monofunctional biosynthetic peptidoglycan transglycosylase
MEVYLNSIEMGPGIYGVEAVAQAHFGSNAKSLNRSQCALIAASLPNPLKLNSAAPSSYMNKRKHQIIRLMSLVKPFSLTDNKVVTE